MRVKIWFIHRPGIRWSIQRFLLCSPWEDVAIEISGRVYGVDKRTGVTRYASDEFHLKYRNKTWTIVDVPEVIRTEFYLNDQLGKPMDSIVLFPFTWHRRWWDNNRWYSSELVTKALMFNDVVSYSERGRITPRILWSLLPKVVVAG